MISEDLEENILNRKLKIESRLLGQVVSAEQYIIKYIDYDGGCRLIGDLLELNLIENWKIIEKVLVFWKKVCYYINN